MTSLTIRNVVRSSCRLSTLWESMFVSAQFQNRITVPKISTYLSQHRAMGIESTHQLICILSCVQGMVFWWSKSEETFRTAAETGEKHTYGEEHYETKVKVSCWDRWFCARLHPFLQYSHESRRQTWTVEVSSYSCFFTITKPMIFSEALGRRESRPLKMPR